jgi:hypothetical protein
VAEEGRLEVPPSLPADARPVPFWLVPESVEKPSQARVVPAQVCANIFRKSVPRWSHLADYWIVPVEVVSLFTSVCMSAAVTPDLFIEEATNVVMAVARPVVPAFVCIMVPPPIMPPPIPPMEIDVEPIIPFIVPSEESFIIEVTIPDDDVVIPTVFAYCDMAAMDMP